MRVSRSVYASLAQRYWNPAWTSDQNRLVYGRDASVEGIGGNLRIELEIDGDEDSLSTLLNALKSQIDHHSLFSAGSPFENRPSTVENLTRYLASQLPRGRWARVTVWETSRLAASQTPDGSTSLHMKGRNLHLELRGTIDSQSGLLISRDTVMNEIEKTFSEFSSDFNGTASEWAKSLFNRLARALPLARLTIDLGGHESLIVGEGSI